jgi:hypothetical protein
LTVAANRTLERLPGGNGEHSTFNIQHPTSNGLAASGIRFGRFHTLKRPFASALKVRC